MTLHVSAHALIHLVPRLDVELGEVALVSRFHPAVVLGILFHIFSPAIRLSPAARHLEIDFWYLHWLVIVFQR